MHWLNWLTVWHIGDFTGLLGLAGVALTFWQVWRAKKTTELVKNAVDGVRQDLNRKSMAFDLGELIRDLEELKELHRLDSRSLLPSRYTAVRRKLIGVRERYAILSAKQRSTIQRSVSLFVKLERELDSDPAATNLDLGLLNQLLNIEMNKLIEILEMLQNG
jgi:hypothetical protein